MSGRKTVILVRPGTVMGRAAAHALQHPVGLCWLAACLRDAGFEPQIIDYEIEPYDPVALSQLIRAARPLAAGFTAMTPVIEQAAAMAAVVKQTDPETHTLAGGAHASALPARTLKEFADFDVVVTGDGEERVVAVCRAAADGALHDAAIPGCAIRGGGGIRDHTAAPAPPLDLDTLPLPARDLLRLDRYRGASTPGIPAATHRATELFTSRGCPGRCIFCGSERMFGRQVRFRSVDHIMAEVHDCITRHKFNHFTIDDDTFTLKKNRVLEFCERMAAESATFDCDTRVDHIDRDMLHALARAGCVKIAYGVETGSPRILESIGKGITIEQIRRAFRLTREAGIMSCAFLMVGSHPEETARDIEQTWRLVRDIDPDLISVMIATPYPGTKLREIMQAENLLPEAPWRAYGQSFQDAPFTRTHALSPRDLKKWQTRLLTRFYLRPAYIARRLAALKNPAEFAYWAGAGVNFIRHITQKRPVVKNSNK